MNPFYRFRASACLVISFFILLTTNAKGQQGAIAGKITDAVNGETLIGATVVIKGTTTGAQTDLDGQYKISSLNPGVYDLVVTYVSYTTKTIPAVRVTEGKTTSLDIVMETAAQETKEVNVTAQANRQSSITLMSTIRNTPAMTVGISAETIRRTPDKNVGESLKRVSGVTIQDNKFIVIRGLNDRYNATMMNNLPVSSWEPDRKSVSFDVFPSNFVDNLLIAKTATPDLPAEFAGGVVQVNTRDIPDENSFAVQIGTGLNTQTTGKSFSYTNSGNMKWLGSDNGTREIPAGLPTTAAYQSLNSYSPIALDYGRSFSNNWAIEKGASAPMNRNLQLSLTRNFNVAGKQSGLLAAFSYNRSLRQDLDTPRRDYVNANDSIPEFTYIDERFTDNLLMGGLLNYGIRFNENSHLYIKNTFTKMMDDQTILREGFNRTLGTNIKANTSQYTETAFIMSQVGGEHKVNAIKLNWVAGYAYTNRDVPDLRRMQYTLGENTMTTAENDSAYIAYVPIGSASNTFAGRFYSKLFEQNINGRVDATVPLTADYKNTVKVGVMKQYRSRTFDARVLGYKILDPTSFYTNNPDLLYQDQGTLFDQQNIGINGFGIDEITNPSDAYTASSDVNAAYIMADQSLLKKLRLIYGIRVENFRQQLTSKSYNGKDITFDNQETKIYPSLNLVYSLTEKQAVRFAYGRTTARPEFRELAPFAFYDFSESGTVRGNDKLQNTFIDNIDLKYEIYPSNNQYFAVTAFYKNFSNPIEPLVNTASSGGNRDYDFRNEDQAQNYGLEFDWRLGFGLLSKNKIMERFAIFGNAAYVSSVISVTLDDGSVDSLTYERPLWGQSPYTINVGLTYQDNERGLGFTLAYNKAGDRIDRVGVKYGYIDRWEKIRPLLDFQVSKRIAKNGEVRFTVANILDRNSIIYQDMNEDNKLFKNYDEGTDRIIRNNRRGTDYSISFNWRF